MASCVVFMSFLRLKKRLRCSFAFGIGVPTSEQFHPAGVESGKRVARKTASSAAQAL
jgi:hypothetical protein